MVTPDPRLATLNLMVARKLAAIAARKTAGETFRPAKRRSALTPEPTDERT